MKKVIHQKRKFGWKDILRIILIVLMHYFGFYAFFVFAFGIHFVIEHTWFPNFGNMIWAIFYCCILAPVLSAILHIVYSEAGSPWTKGVMWLHSIFVAITVFVCLFL